MVELVAIDLDGTLLTSGKKITERTKRVLRALSNQGIKVLLATARPPRSVAGAYKALKLDTCAICYNGALIYDPPSRTVLAHHPIQVEMTRKIIHMARDVHPDIVISVEVLDHWFTDRLSLEYKTEVSKQFVPDKLAPIETWLNCDVTKILILGPEHYLTSIRNQLVYNFAKKLSIVQSDHNLLQIMAGGVSKGKALKFVCRHYDIPLRRTIAIGDANNDLEMLELAGIGIAMADSPSKVKKAADYVTTTNDEDGVADALEKFAL
ncbi:MAG: Cof-type HAD-IIB family hydrolase [Phycisphaerae bacterium]